MKYFLFVLCVLLCPVNGWAQTSSTNSGETNQSSAQNLSPQLQALTFGAAGGALLRNESVGGYVSGLFDFQSNWAYVGLNISIGALGNSSNDWLLTEITGYGHLLAIGVSDITYRRYIDGDEVRFLGGFSYTETHENIVRVDVNLGVGYFDESNHLMEAQEWGIQIGARVRARFWRFENFLQLSVFQNLEVGTGEIDLSGTEIICENFDEVLAGGDLECRVPEPDPEEEPTTGGGLVNWQTTGFLITERLFVNIHEETQGERWGPEIEIRVEKTPLRGLNFWAMVSFRYYWSSLGI